MLNNTSTSKPERSARAFLENPMHCDKCGQPLQPWEIATCEPCLRRIQNFPNLQLTQQQSAATLPQTPSKVQGEPTSKEAEMEPAVAAAIVIVIFGVLGYFAQ